MMQRTQDDYITTLSKDTVATISKIRRNSRLTVLISDFYGYDDGFIRVVKLRQSQVHRRMDNRFIFSLANNDTLYIIA